MQLVKETFPLLKELSGILILSEALRQERFHMASADVIVCEAFAGNVILKLYEGRGRQFLSQNQRRYDDHLSEAKIGALLVKPALKTDIEDI